MGNALEAAAGRSGSCVVAGEDTGSRGPREAEAGAKVEWEAAESGGALILETAELGAGAETRATTDRGPDLGGESSCEELEGP